MRLSCYLLRDSATPSTSLRATEADVSYFLRRDATWTAQDSIDDLQEADAVGVLYRTTSPDPSLWQAMVARWDEEVLAAESDFALLDRQDRGAIFFFRAGNPERWLAWTFGRGHQYLVRSRLEPRFGVTCALNELSGPDREAALRKMQVRRSSGVTQVVGRATFEDAPVSAFELDEVWDAIRSVGGRSADSGSVYGATSLVRASHVDSPDELGPISSANLDLFRQDNYKAEFSFLDNYIPVTDLTLESDLDDHCSVLLMDPDVPAAFAYPSTVASFGSREQVAKVLFAHEGEAHGRLHVSMELVRSHSKLASDDAVHLDAPVRFTSEGETLGRHPLKECIAAQFDFGGATYVLAEGVYYEVAVDFLREVDQFVTQRIQNVDPLPAYRGGDEDSWLDRVAELDGYTKVHPNRFNYPNTVGTVELADVLTSQPRLLHVKRGADAQSVGAVTRQVVSAAEALLHHTGAVEWLRDRCPDEALAAMEAAGNRPPIGVVLLGHQGHLPRMSLFAKLELRRALRYVEGLEFETGICFVPTTP